MNKRLFWYACYAYLGVILSVMGHSFLTWEFYAIIVPVALAEVLAN